MVAGVPAKRKKAGHYRVRELCFNAVEGRRVLGVPNAPLYIARGIQACTLREVKRMPA